MLRRSKKISLFILIVLSVIVVHSCRKAQEWDETEWDERLSGGTQTVFSEGRSAFSMVFPTLSGPRLAFHEFGDGHFEASFVSSPAKFFPGLGTIYNGNACINCHINDGRGKPLSNQEALSGFLFRISMPGFGPNRAPVPVPNFGEQLQDKAVLGYSPEAGVTVSWEEHPFFFADGDSVMLRKPTWSFVNGYLPFPAGMLYSPRVAPPVHGLGLLEQVDDFTLQQMVDEADGNGDGISGRMNRVWDAKSKSIKTGRFGWKAEAASLDHQVAAAYNEDMGITSVLFPRENSLGQTQYDHLTDENEISDSVLNAVIFYVRTLAVPARRKVDQPEVMAGAKIFKEAGCENCHIRTLRTKTSMDFPEASNQIIHPYTDLLLHDMGENLSDHRPVYFADGAEWRTPPLWGIGLTQLVNGHNYYLHDGRARNFMEAILWHGGEAAGSVEHIRKLSKKDRELLLMFIQSL